MSELLKKITDLTAGTPADTDVIPYVDLVTGTTKKALKSELKGDKGDTGTAATVDAGTTATLAAGESATVTNVGTTAAAIFNFAIPQGIQGVAGADGADGACVESVAFVGNDIVFTLDDSSTITLTNAKVTLKGDKGDTGAKITSAEFVGNDLVFTLDDSSTVTITGAKTALKGETGDDGTDGDAATIAVGTVTTVASTEPATVTNVGTSSAAVFDFEIPKGTDGAGSGDISGSGTANEIAYFTAEKTIDNLPVATYPSLTELSYVKGVSSAIQTQIGGKVTANAGITGATKTKITYDAKGLVTFGEDATTADIAESSNKRYVTDAQLTVLENTSGTNTGDVTVTDSTEIDFTLTGQQITASIKSASIDESKLDTSVNASLDLADSSVQPTSTNTLTNKRTQPRVYSTTSVSTLTPEVDTYNVFVLTAQAEALNIANHSTSTPANGEMILIEMVCDGTPRALSFGTNYVAKAGTALPTTLVASKRTTLLFKWCSDISEYNLLTVGQEA